MARIVTTSTGDGITMRTDRLQVLDGSDPIEAQVWRQFLAHTHDRLNQPWGNYRRLVDALRVLLEQLEAQLPDDPELRRQHYKPRSAKLWYVLEAVRRANLIEKYIPERPWEAVSLAVELGELVTELALKADFEKQALAGGQILDARGQGARARRKQSREDRVRMVDELVASGWKKGAAFQEVAARCGVGHKAIIKDYYKK
jgi:hypothetical protein